MIATVNNVLPEKGTLSVRIFMKCKTIEEVEKQLADYGFYNSAVFIINEIKCVRVHENGHWITSIEFSNVEMGIER